MKDDKLSKSIQRIEKSHKMSMSCLGVEDDTLTREAIDYVKVKMERLERLENYLDKWNKQLSIDGVNSKSMVANDIQHLIKERNNG